ncbi:hypothetical protein CHLRE_03g152326v5 [Chlamydomonas reinhardtii]|uniref:Uncharacterized protein n=1 Tax=Chlamydomonas reinhardtii TaxID=3055 RepID=A0A2K3DVS4_CHLRE|nr:uncharacterized protein CHLRE_03g152326v5 [Chlamydomonas reinhardtii]PNW84635.1 hypothetical protein CHLRE_03g152326v5 [Chlamydomonas reinhardtii]
MGGNVAGRKDAAVRKPSQVGQRAEADERRQGCSAGPAYGRPQAACLTCTARQPA